MRIFNIIICPIDKKVIIFYQKKIINVMVLIGKNYS